VFGGGVGSGTTALNAYAQWTFERNVLAGATAAVYPTNNAYPARFPQDIGFVDPVNGDYRLSLSSPYKNRATDGRDPGVDFDALSAKTARALNGISETLGDYNGDGKVDAADYTVWHDSLGRTGTGLAADGNGNGLVDFGDYDVWNTNYGNHSGLGTSGNAAIPEPTTRLILFVGMLAICECQRQTCLKLMRP
jgi:hypothetical protein